jgi:hypothetical protein
MSAPEMVKLALESKTLRTVANLPKETAAAIRNCAKKVDDVSDDQRDLME